MVIVSKWQPVRSSVLCYASGLAEAAGAFGVNIGTGVRILGRVKDAYIAAKERWASKMAGQKHQEPRSANRLPPGQRQVQDFPVVDLGVRPEMPLEKWELKIQGQVDNPVTLTWPQFLALPQFKDVSDFHCVTTWSQFDMEWEGVSLLTIAEIVRPKREARHILFESYDGYSTNNPIEVCLDDDVLIAHKWNGKPLSLEHGGPARVIIPKRYAWKGAKFIHQITFLDRDVLGYWELRGYSNTADPWSEDRFADKNSIPPGFP